MDSELQKLNSLIEAFKVERKPTDNNTGIKEKLPSLIEWLKIEKIKFLNKNLPYLKKDINKNFKKLRISALSLMEYDFHENSHSNILAYLFDYNSFDGGCEILSEIVKNTSFAQKNELSEKIKKQSYSVYREFSIKTKNSYGRIDLFVEDKCEKFIIVIENKILAGIGETIGEEENSIPVTQLEKYEKWCNENYADYFQLYILLNFSNNDDNTSLFEKISYRHLYDNLNNSKFTDNIFEDYLLLLKSLLNPVTQDLFKIKKLANKIIEDESPEISLTDYYTLKTIFYAK